jgi:hypothetical protein
MKKPSRLSDAIDYIIFFLILLGLVTMLNSCAPRPDTTRARKEYRFHRIQYNRANRKGATAYYRYGEGSRQFIKAMERIGTIGDTVREDLRMFNTLSNLK